MNAATTQTADAPAEWGPLSALPGHPLMWVLIASELAVFGLALLGYAGARAQNPLAFALEQDSLNRLAGVANTALLLTSGYFAARANQAAHAGDATRTRLWLAAASALGLGFLVVKGFEYAGEFAAGHDIDSSPFFTLYFLVTGFHALHVVLGLIILGIVGRLATKTAVETGTAFWHMVDLIWLVVFPVFYLMR
ncbi:nitric oxide reductase NorE protein [Rhodoblastus acidophilus]|uniref:cytochrome c oxidase subunit 3 n=1 Tax=Rhodoblastus acidophilus TaxID=1074 RepID=UPI002224AEE8|nr:cytochrome c oxidase subunit 3 [Rhodoblastus acidophilus]MCW2285078.1 nitric oxide reductase NorE protein [Rhodoblastus acidophilus]MCW2334064.1 nitric oxide reductase NorE protein [Rhodoblastus acidophilus]